VTRVHVVMPVDDPARPSGGNVYDRRLCGGLRRLGYDVEELVVAGAWPWAEPSARRSLREALAAVPDGSNVVIDGLLASTSPDAVVPEAARLRIGVLVHLPVSETLAVGDPLGGREREEAVLASAHAVITTSGWTRSRLLARYALEPSRVHVAPPGAEPAPLAPCEGARLLVVGAVTPTKGTDLLVDALARVADGRWTCDVVGSLDVHPWFAARVLEQVRATGLCDRVRFHGPLVGNALAERYAVSDLLVTTSRLETYGMVVTEALARGIPVVATGVGGVREALGSDTDGGVPGLVVDAEDAAAIAQGLRSWLDDPALRSRLRAAAAERRVSLTGWDVTATRVAAVVADPLVEVAA
jgi:glycosyltransferase involved in cell wall biosynthesis